MMMSIKMRGENGLFTPTFSHVYKLKSVQINERQRNMVWLGHQ